MVAWRPPAQVSCSTWGRSTVVRCCLKTVWDKCVGLIDRLVCRSQRCRRCNSCGFDTALRKLKVGDTFQDRRQPGHQDTAASGAAAGQHLPQNSQPVPPGEPLDDSPLPNCPSRDVVLTDRDKQLLSELRRASAMALPRCLVSRYASAWAESLEGAMSSHQSSTLLCSYRCRLLLAEIPKGVDRNSELKQRLQLWEWGQVSVLICKVLGQQNSGQFRRRVGKTQPQTDEQRGKRACALSARGSINKAVKGLVGGAAQGSADCRRNWTTALILRSLGTGTHPTTVERVDAVQSAWGGGRCKLARSAMREQGRSKTGIASLPHVKLSPMSALASTGDRKEHLDAIVSFAGAGQRRRVFRGSHDQVGDRRLAGRVPLPAQHAADLSQERERPGHEAV